ncbi:ATP-binding protein [Luteimonas sp. 9C]|uniref:ATP-binding protein n=1 Tax=Luteimonas sp. 9C TaxID=2653148 RepID=UPI00135BFBCF|nr:ATP-binding protein [Luteimonas sp. 9C]
MIEALRGLGYTSGTALADIIDNSISAGAGVVDVTFGWAGQDSWVSVLDDGVGMDDAELESAMRLGDKNPIHDRETTDLGRFGLGLKTASFSQCRRLTVSSWKNAEESVLRWDLDLLAAGDDGGWDLLESAAPGSETRVNVERSTETGTLVVWEILDRLVPKSSTEQDFLELIDRVERHLAMVFHRYLDGSGQDLLISINGKRIAPWDPFLASHPATWTSPPVSIETAYGVIRLQGHVLPHKDKLRAKELEQAAGPDGWTAQQGFYVYRNQRLLLAGSWLGLGKGRSWTKEESFRLARIRLDIPNSADADWKIDIRKSTARPPVAIRERIARLAEDIRDRARKVFAHRGKPLRRTSGDEVGQAWLAEHFLGGIRYRVQREHPAVKAVLEDAGDLSAQVVAMLRVLEETIPVQRIWLDTAEATETPRTGFADQPSEEVSGVLAVMYRNLVLRKGMSPSAAKRQLALTEPFNLHLDLVERLPDLVPEYGDSPSC